MAPVEVHKGMPAVKLARAEFERRYRSRYLDPAFKPLQKELDAIVSAAWQPQITEHTESRSGFADPNYDIAIDWLKARDAIHDARQRHDARDVKPRILIVNG